MIDPVKCPESGEMYFPCEMRVGAVSAVCGAPSVGQLTTRMGGVICICTDCRAAFGYAIADLKPLPRILYECEHCHGTGIITEAAV